MVNAIHIRRQTVRRRIPVTHRGLLRPCDGQAPPQFWQPNGHGVAGDLPVHAAGAEVHARVHRGQLGLPPPKVCRNSTGTAILRLLLGSAFLSYTKSTGEYDVAVIGTFFSLEFTEYLAPMCLYRVVTQVAQKYLLTGKLWLDSVTNPL